MAALATCMKRLHRERERLPKDNAEFFISFKDSNLQKFEAYIVGPEDSVYKHKFIKLRFEVPDNYPLVPPKVTFVQHTGDRLHPNLYTNGKVCLSILGTWPGDPWTYAMTIESVLIQIRSLLDNKPYLHEPNKRDDPEYNKYVRYHSWQWLLCDYLERERDLEARGFLEGYVRKYGAEMVEELEGQRRTYGGGGSQRLVSPYGKGGNRVVDYAGLIARVRGQLTAYGYRAPTESSKLQQISPITHLKSISHAAESTKENTQPSGQRKRKSPNVFADDPDASSKRLCKQNASAIIDLTGD